MPCHSLYCTFYILCWKFSLFGLSWKISSLSRWGLIDDYKQSISWKIQWKSSDKPYWFVTFLDFFDQYTNWNLITNLTQFLSVSIMTFNNTVILKLNRWMKKVGWIRFRRENIFICLFIWMEVKFHFSLTNLLTIFK